MITGKENADGSFSVAIPASKLLQWGFVDFYDDDTGGGYQRHETLRRRRGADIAKYIGRCVSRNVPPRLFELTANARVPVRDVIFERIDPNHPVGILSVPVGEEGWLSVIDGGTRLLGIQMAIDHGSVPPDFMIDVRMFRDLRLPEEIAQFLLINEKQKRVRTDLSLRVVQRLLDEGELDDEQNKVLRTVVPESDSWRFDASRIAGRMNKDADSPWAGLIKMPNDTGSKPVKLQAVLSSLKPLLKNEEVMALMEAVAEDHPSSDGGDDLLLLILKNFWNAVARANPSAHSEPSTSVLWGSIGVSSCHIGLAPILESLLKAEAVDLSVARFETMVTSSQAASYPFWFSRPGSKGSRDKYPGEKGEATRMTGAANYGRLGKNLEKDWRAALHSGGIRRVVVI